MRVSFEGGAAEGADAVGQQKRVVAVDAAKGAEKKMHFTSSSASVTLSPTAQPVVLSAIRCSMAVMNLQNGPQHATDVAAFQSEPDDVLVGCAALNTRGVHDVFQAY